MLTGPLEQIKILTKKSNSLGFKESRHPLTAVTLTFSSPITQKAYFKAATALNLASICIHKFIHSPQSFSFFVSQNDKDKTVDCLHNTFFE
jgi:aspartokinase